MKVIIFGSSGQVGMTVNKNIEKINKIKDIYNQHIDITEKKSLEILFDQESPNLVINCAAYTNVNMAEQDEEKSYKTNAIAVRDICSLCNIYDVTLIHYSTDYVFDGKSKTPYTESSPLNPINMYGKSKMAGEEYIKQFLKKHIIIRTSWLYSQHRRNFFNFMIDSERAGVPELSIVCDQIGSPTSVNEVVKHTNNIIDFIERNECPYGTYNISCWGEVSWYEFALKIKNLWNLSLKIIPIHTHEFNSIHKIMVERPAYSALDSMKYESFFGKKIKNWEDALIEFFEST